ncbi:hypothetical protein ABZT49_06195 [Methylobacterium sp. EM32]|uniref:hypothetical protein n=1 Tax=Methylobacterium sp. EM32 TaxID=3163481 RepID=UPI0033BE3CA1
MLTDRELVMVEAARTDAVAEPVIVIGIDCAQGSDDPTQPKGPVKFEWVPLGEAARAVIQARRTRDADLPAVGTFHG